MSNFSSVQSGSTGGVIGLDGPLRPPESRLSLSPEALRRPLSPRRSPPEGLSPRCSLPEGLSPRCSLPEGLSPCGLSSAGFLRSSKLCFGLSGFSALTLFSALSPPGDQTSPCFLALPGTTSYLPLPRLLPADSVIILRRDAFSAPLGTFFFPGRFVLFPDAGAGLSPPAPR